MSILPDFSRQYQPPKIPTHWSADERRFAQGVTDVLDDIYLRYGRLSKKDLSPALSKEILDASGNIVQLQLDTSGLTTRMLSAEGSLSTLQQTATSFGTRISNAEGGISTLTQTAAGIETRVGNAEGDISTLEQTATSLGTRISNAEGAISIAQQQADKIQWLVSSGTSAANMTLTSRLYSLMAANIDLSANNSIKLAVSGSVNLRPESLAVTPNITERITVTETTDPTFVYRGTKAWRAYFGDTGTRYLRLCDGYSFTAGTTYTISCYVRAGGEVTNMTYLDTINSPTTNTWSKVAIPGTSDYYKCQLTFVPSVTGVPTHGPLLYVNPDRPAPFVSLSVSGIQLEYGNIATAWSPAPSDPASGVKTSKITIDTNGVAIATGGVFTVSSGNFGIDASGNVTMKGRVEATSGKIGGFTLLNGALTSDTGFFIDPTLPLPQMNIKHLNMGSTSNGAYLMCMFTAGLSTFNIRNPYGIVDITGGRSNQWGGSLTLSRDENGLKLAQIQDKLQVSDTVYIENNCSALSFTDRTPAYTGNALDELRWVRGNRAQGIDHNSIPPFARKTIKNTRTLPDGTVEHYHEPGRDLGAMISILTKAVQEIDDRMNAFERRLPA